MNASGNTLPEAYLQNSWDNNPQGAGLLWVENGKLTEFKTFKCEELKKKYFELRGNAFIGNIVLHFRISTSGKHNEENLHPFFVDKGLAFVHNGVIHGLGDTIHSDTWHFNNSILRKLPKGFLDIEGIEILIKKAIGHSKLLFLDKNDKFHIINEHLGSFDKDGNWFSNTSHLQLNSYVFYGNTKVKKQTIPNTNSCFCKKSNLMLQWENEKYCFSCGKRESIADKVFC
jgi:predicted glutamine amidotransferase